MHHTHVLINDVYFIHVIYLLFCIVDVFDNPLNNNNCSAVFFAVSLTHGVFLYFLMLSMYVYGCCTNALCCVALYRIAPNFRGAQIKEILLATPLQENI